MAEKVGYQAYDQNGRALVVAESIPGETGFDFVGAASGADINIGSGVVGEVLNDITIFNNSGSPITQVSIKDGTTEIIGLRDLTSRATGATFTVTGPRTKSKAGGWKINITCAGTMSQIFGFARAKPPS